MKKFIPALLCLLAFAHSAVAQERANIRKIDSLLTYLTERNLFMGSAAILEKDRPVFEKAYGYVDTEAGIAATPATLYKIASISKMFTAAMVMQLAEEKKLSQDMKLSQFFPQVKNADKITIAHLLSHRSGIFDLTDEEGFDPTVPVTRGAMLQRIAGYGSNFEPGSKFVYSNTNYILLAYIIEEITGKTYDENMQERITKKANLPGITSYDIVEPGKGEAYSYYFDGEWGAFDQWDQSVVTGGGGLQATAGDIARYIRALFKGKIVSNASLKEMAEVDEGYGKGMYRINFPEKYLLGHTGRIEGFISLLCYDRDSEVSIAIINNGQNHTGIRVQDAVLRCYYGMDFTFPDIPTCLTVSPETLKAYEGTYACEAPIKIDIRYSNGRLTAQATGQEALELCAVGDTEFNYYEAGINLKFNGKGGFLLQQGSAYVEFEKETD